MKVKVLVLVFITQLILPLFNAFDIRADEKSLDYFLPANSQYNPEISTPESSLGFQVGQWHARHDQVIAYMRHLAAQSPRVSVIEMGKTWENRPQILLVITAEENQANLEEIIKARTVKNPKTRTKSPLVVWLGYSVHGNEASGTNASLLSAYHLSAKTGEEHEQFLKDTIVLIEPSLNPDGYGRFSTWANNNRSINLSSDPNDREHNEDWPMGRTNHYRFDLNRDWLLAQHPESKARLNWFHKFKPHVLGDFHEMGPNSSYFFQPGVPARQNPLTPTENFDITDSIARHHAKILDAAGSLYYSKESYDDFYYGKGSTYPDINGGIGILFEQASALGHVQDTINGPLTFAFAIRNHFLTSLSTLQGAYIERNRIIDYQQTFYDKSLTMARNDNTRAVVISDDGDKARAAAFVDILLRHQIKVYELALPIKTDGQTIKSGLIVPFNQSQYRLIKSLFETRTQFKDNTFYDVSSWTLPHAFNLPFSPIDRKNWKQKLIGKAITTSNLDEGKVAGKAKVAYAFDWNDYRAPAALTFLLKNKFKVKVAAKEFSSTTSTGKESFSAGSIIIPLGLQTIEADDLHQLMLKVAQQFNIQISAIDSGYSLSGIDMGSENMKVLRAPKPLLLTGFGTSSYDTGELWYLLDRHLQMELTQAKLRDFSSLSLNSYTHLILAQGNYNSLESKDIASIKEWINQGGTLIAMKSAAQWAAKNALIDVNFMKEDDDDDQPITKSKAYSTLAKDDAQDVIGGSIFSTRIDISHPLAFGYQRSFLPVFRNHTMIMNPSSNLYATIVRYNKEPLLSGFVSNDNLEKIADSAMMVAERKGQGSVILILDNPVFRGFWYGTSRLFINSLFFGRSFRNPAN
ncbi:MAG: hypothetical protein ACI9IA_000542 [Enterobacterales bacterium]|jgi:hypothetical protein